MAQTNPSQSSLLGGDIPTHHEIWKETKRDKIERLSRHAEAQLKADEKLKADIEFGKNPYWIRQSLEGDYMSDGSDSGMNTGDNYEED